VKKVPYLNLSRFDQDCLSPLDWSCFASIPWHSSGYWKISLKNDLQVSDIECMFRKRARCVLLLCLFINKSIAVAHTWRGNRITMIFFYSKLSIHFTSFIELTTIYKLSQDTMSTTSSNIQAIYDHFKNFYGFKNKSGLSYEIRAKAHVMVIEFLIHFLLHI
jgi:hypothetical protein